MSVETHPPSHQDRSHTSTADDPERPRSAGRSILASLVVGAGTALVLTLIVFAGGTEAAITGSTLLGFGIGWALIAILTVRRTSQPQRWAIVPAVAMGATGAALLSFRPDDDTMTALSQIWPPVTLALAIWMFVRMRRFLQGRGRWLLTPVIGVLALASVGATYGNIALRSDLDSYPPSGRLYSVGGHRLHLDCHGTSIQTGEGGPTVVLFNGLGGSSASWARITGPVAATTRVCAYDRPGQGWSDEVDGPQDGLTAAADLHALLEVAGEHGPYVLVGHSTGGTYALTYAARYPEQVAGMVLLDSSSPEQFTRMADYPAQYALMRRGLALLPTVQRLGLSHLLAPASHLPAAAAKRVTAVSSTPRAARNGRDELSVIRDVFTQAQALATLHNQPLAVLTASENASTDGWFGAQKELAELSSNRLHRTVRSSHEGFLSDAHPAVELVRAIAAVTSAVRTSTPVTTR